MAIIIDGKELAKKIRANLKIECEELKNKQINPKLAVIMVGNNSASQIYVRNKNIKWISWIRRAALRVL